jgi:hypothetical protein
MAETKDFGFNHKSIEAYTKEGLDAPRGLIAEKERCDRFKAKHKEDKEIKGYHKVNAQATDCFP